MSRQVQITVRVTGSCPNGCLLWKDVQYSVPVGVRATADALVDCPVHGERVTLYGAVDTTGGRR